MGRTTTTTTTRSNTAWRAQALLVLAAASLLSFAAPPSMSSSLLLRGVSARRILATVPYKLSSTAPGKGLTFLGADGAATSAGAIGPGGHILMDLALLDDKGSNVGKALGSCTVVSADGQAVCSVHLLWDGGASSMVAQLAAAVDRAGGGVSGRLVVLGGIGRWQGAHGEDSGFAFSGRSGGGGGRIVLNCLDGVC